MGAPVHNSEGKDWGFPENYEWNWGFYSLFAAGCHPLKICRGKDDITTFFKVNPILPVSIKYSSEIMMPWRLVNIMLRKAINEIGFSNILLRD